MKIIKPLFLSIALLGNLLSVSSINAQPFVAKRYTDLIINAGEFKTFRALEIAAESKASKYIKQAFNTNASQVMLQVLGDRNGLISPIFTISVSNAQWRSRSNIQAWAKYYPVSTFLLGYSIRTTPLIPLATPANTTNPPAKPVTSPPQNITAPPNSPEIAPSDIPRAAQTEVQNFQGFRDD